MPPFEPTMQMDYPQSEIQRDPRKFKSVLNKSARKLFCSRFFDWLTNSGVLDEILASQNNCTLFLPMDHASSKLPLNVLSSMNTQPERMKKLIKLHAVPDSFQNIYPGPVPRSQVKPSIPTRTLSNDNLRMDMSMLPNDQGQYVPLVSGCPMINSHQIGPVRLVSTGSVLFPPQPSVYSVIRRSPNLKLCNEIIENSGMSQSLNSPHNTFTMFPPTDEAMQKRFSRRQLNSLIRSPERCKSKFLAFLFNLPWTYISSNIPSQTFSTIT